MPVSVSAPTKAVEEDVALSLLPLRGATKAMEKGRIVEKEEREKKEIEKKVNKNIFLSFLKI